MLRNITITLAALAAAALAASPALAQSGPDGVAERGKLTNGAFELTLNGEVPADMSFYIEANFGSGSGVVCTTDQPMVRAGFTECVGNGAINEMPFVAPAGHKIEYRVLGSRGVELSQVVVAEGSEIATEGLVIGASYTFPGDFAPASPVVDKEPSTETGHVSKEGSNTGNAPVEPWRPAAAGIPEAQEVSTASTAHSQYEGVVDPRDDVAIFTGPEPNRSQQSISGSLTKAAAAPGPADATEGSSELLPDTGGAPTLLLGGGALLAIAGVLALRRVL